MRAEAGRRGGLAGRLVLVVAAAASLLGAAGLAPTGAALVATTGTEGAWKAAGLVAPSGVTVSQTCLPAPAPVFRAASSTSGDGSTTVVLTTPASVVAGDLLLASVTWYADGDIPAPSGWTKVRNDFGQSVSQSVFYRVAQATEPATHTFTHLAGFKYGGIVAHSGVDPASLLLTTGSSGQTSRSSTGVTAPSLTVRRAGTVVVGFFGVQSIRTVTTDSRMTMRHTGSSSGSGNSQVSALAATELRTTTGATDVRTATFTTGGNPQVVGQLVALEPPLQPHATTSWTRSPSSEATGQLFRRYSGATLQRETALPVDTTSTSDGPLVSGTAYRMAVLATAGTLRSSEATLSFTGQTCTGA